MSRELQVLLNELATIRCYASLFRSDADLVTELLDLRAFRDAHPLPAAAKPFAKAALPKSALVRHMEAQVIFGEYCERECRRLTEKLKRMDDGVWSPDDAAADADERARNDQIGRRAVDLEADATPRHLHKGEG